jgi:VIT1/CCC1 family predicted Fe2+/Mn2+ transporter
VTSAVTIGLSYVAGGLIPLAPYFFVKDLHMALVASVTVTITALMIFGGIKAKITGIPVLRGAGQTALIGGLAASAAFLIARVFQ